MDFHNARRHPACQGLTFAAQRRFVCDDIGCRRARFGFDEGVAGHITARDPELPDHFWVNPFGMYFGHIRVSDLLLVRHDGTVVHGDMPVNQAAFLCSQAAAGTVLVGGVPLTRVSNNDLRTRLTVVPQEPFLFEGSIAAKRLCAITYDAMWKGIAKVKPGARLGDIGHAIQVFAEGHGFSVVREFCGHGIGRKFHEEPQVLHYGKPGTLELLVPGMVFTIEPMINAGKREIRDMGDGWTIVTKDRSLSAQWEHTVLVTETGYEVLTVSAGSPAVPQFVNESVTA